MKKKFKQFVRWAACCMKAITPDKNFLNGASQGLLGLTAVLWLIYSIAKYLQLNDPFIFLLSFVYVLAAILFAFAVGWTLKSLNRVPSFYKRACLISVPLLIHMSFEWMIPTVVSILASLCGAVVLFLKKNQFQRISKSKKGMVVAGILVGFGGFTGLGLAYYQEGFDLDPIINAARSSDPSIVPIQAIAPSERGPYSVKKLTYGSGKDLHRPEYGAAVDIKTNPVNGLAFIDNWEGFGGWWREKYFGFNSSSLPINARVWYPEGEGPFPLALVVHGNHSMQDYSDPGYEYLGELLASKGIILASVDENFINGSWSNLFGRLEKENDARAWLLLEHLKVWHVWNEKANHLFYKKIDTTNIALIGHSRGGESVAHAAMFNKLPFYPDDATVKFDYNYKIKSIVAIAPVDGQYQPGGSRTAIEDINYFVIHGSQDADVNSFMGSQQYERVTFKDSAYHFKSGLYVYGANHGQFNTTWGRNDRGNPFLGFLNLKQQISTEAQLKIAKVYIGSFLDITLKNKHEYLPLFYDSRTGGDWLPETIYLNQFEDSNLKTIANFDEDFDVTTTTQEAGSLAAKNLSVWREQAIQLVRQKKGTRALIVGWNYDIENKEKSIESVPDSLIASYTVHLPSIALDSSSALVFSLAESKESANPKSEGKWVKNHDNEKKDPSKKDDKKTAAKDDKDKVKDPIDFTIQLTDYSGQKVSFPLSRFSSLQRAIEVVIMKTDFVTDDKQSEKVFQTFYFPVTDFLSINPYFTISEIEEITFVFDKSESGVVSFDNIGFMKTL